MKLDRLIGILALLLQRERVTATELAERFEVSQRTIHRDIEALGRAGIPVATRQGAGGGISIMEGYRVDRTLLTSSDMQAILAGLRSLDSVSGTNRYALLMEKMQAGASTVLPAGQHILIDLASWYGASLSEKVERIHGAIEGCRAIGFRYSAPGGDSLREVEPAHLVFQWASWYVWGWCRTRRDTRLFKLNRMSDLKVLDPFEPRELPLPDLASERVFPDRFILKARIAPEHRWRVVEEYGEGFFTADADGWLLFEKGFSDKEQVLTWILSFRDGAELLEPEELRSELLDAGRKIVRRYS